MKRLLYGIIGRIICGSSLHDNLPEHILDLVSKNEYFTILKMYIQQLLKQ